MGNRFRLSAESFDYLLGARRVIRVVNFAEDASKLQDYSSEVERLAKPQAVTKTLTSKILSMTSVFSDENILVCFTAWLFILGILAAFGTWAMLRTFPTVKMDSVLVSMVVGTPIVGAATLVAIGRQRLEHKKGHGSDVTNQ